jgi:hypothetical protein
MGASRQRVAPDLKQGDEMSDKKDRKPRRTWTAKDRAEQHYERAVRYRRLADAANKEGDKIINDAVSRAQAELAALTPKDDAPHGNS